MDHKLEDGTLAWVMGVCRQQQKERTIDVIKGYVEVNDDVENETMRYIGKVWTERQKNEKIHVNVLP